MGYMPEKEEDLFSYIGITKEEYENFVQRATELVIEGIERYM